MNLYLNPEIMPGPTAIHRLELAEWLLERAKREFYGIPVHLCSEGRQELLSDSERLVALRFDSWLRREVSKWTA